MFNLTRAERQVLLFVISVALAGIGINFLAKRNSAVEKAVCQNDRLTRINLNQASLEELTAPRMISPGLAKKIIAYRTTHGQFQTLEELKEVQGIGDYRYEKLKGLFFVE